MTERRELSEIVLDPESHIYYVAGVRVPGVTKILQDAGFVDYRFCPQDAISRGQWVHSVIAEMEADMFSARVDGRIDWAGYIAAWEEFRATIDYGPGEIEIARYREDLGYCGTPDVVYPGAGVVIDYKTGSPRPADAIQLAGYALLVGNADRSGRDWRRVGVYLRADGSYRAVEYDDRSDIDVFIALTRCVAWKRANGMWHG